jgi:hypothetical protein
MALPIRQKSQWLGTFRTAGTLMVVRLPMMAIIESVATKRVAIKRAVIKRMAIKRVAIKRVAIKRVVITTRIVITV